MYITKPLSPRYPQMPIDALFDFDNTYDVNRYKPICDPSATTTMICDRVPKNVFNMWRPERTLNSLLAFNYEFADVVDLPDYRPHYHHYTLPKKNGKRRPIDQPLPRLRQAQDKLVTIIKASMPANHHASAYAYVEKRETKNAVEKHQKNDSHWFAKFDFTNFFGSTTPEFVFRMLKDIYPFSWIYETGNGHVVETAFSICFLNGGLPQGSPVSPMLTNIMMIPLDHCLCNTLHNYKHKSYIYTRYADDMQISCQYDFDVKEIEKLIVDTLASFKAPFSLNKEKTHYGSRAGRNYMLGIKLNADNAITVGYQEKKFFKANLNNYIMDRKNKRGWELEDIQSLKGKLAYYRHIEKEYFDNLVARMNDKYHVDVDAMLKNDIKSLA